MIATRIFCFLLLMLPFVACSDDDNTAPALPQPSGLVATGALGRITLAWSGTNGGGMEGYRIYRSQNGTDYTLLTNVTGTGWTNQLPADGTADGIYYHYRITTFKSNTESLPSAAVRQMHGTRLPALYAETTQYLTESGSSPYVVEGTSFIKHTLNIAAGTKLYLLPGSTLIILTNRNLDCNGTIQSLGEPGNPVTITCKKDDGSEPGSIGFRPQFYNTSPAWDPLTRTGSILQHTLVTNIYNYISFHSCRMMVTNCKFGPATSAVASFLVEGPDGPVVTRSLLQNLPLDVRGSHEGGTLSFARNRIRCPGYYATMIFYYSLVAPPLGTGQVVQNSFDGTKCIDVIQQNNTGIQLGNNHWAGSANNPPVPEVIYNSATTNIYFAPVLSVAPDPCGPTW